jgi:hypothetical protein
MRQLLNPGKRNVKLIIIIIGAEYYTTDTLRNTIKDVIGAVSPVIQQFHNAGFSQIELRIDKP